MTRHPFLLMAVALVLLLAPMVGWTGAQTAPPALTEIDRLRLENLVLRAQLVEALRSDDACRVQLAPLRTTQNAAALKADTDRVKAAIEAAHPGFSFNLQTGQLEVQASAPPKTEKP